MARSRLSTALDDGDLVLPDGALTIVRPPIGYDVSGLSGADVRIVHGFKPDCAYWEATGHDVAQEITASAAVLVVVPRSKSLARALIAEAAKHAPFVIIDGQRTDGIDSLFKDIRKLAGAVPSVAKAHGRLFWVASDAVPGDWAADVTPVGDGYVTRPGVFSESGADKGSMALLAALPAKLPNVLCDLGGGWGYLTGEVLKSHPNITRIDMVEAETLAVDCARLNVTDPRAQIHWGDALTWQTDVKYGGILCNPPFHTSRTAEPALGQQFIAAAARLLAPNGGLWLVANRHLPYETALQQAFVRVDEIAGNGAFKVFHAQRPKK